MSDRTSVVVKTPAGLLATQPQNSELLPREARNLLMLIDGRKTLEQYHAQLNNMAMFKEAGGVELYFQLLMDMEFIRLETIESFISTIGSDEIPTLTEAIPNKAVPPTPTTPDVRRSKIRRHNIAAQDTTTNKSDDSLSERPFDDVKKLGSLHGKISAEMATAIEQHANPEETWELLMKLESCNTDSQLISFLTILAKGKHGPISKIMTNLMKSLKKSKLI